MSSSILTDGKLKPGIYRIQNLVGQTFVEMQEGPRQLCCRTEAALSSQAGLVRSAEALIAEISESDLWWSGDSVVCSGISNLLDLVTLSGR